jgi:hypothetical protein
MGPPDPKKKGRPVGAKDAKPRTRRPTVRVEPIPQEPRADNVAGAGLDVHQLVSNFDLGGINAIA